MPGDDVSCLNLYRPEPAPAPGRLAGLAQAPASTSSAPSKTPKTPGAFWISDFGPDVIPAVADDNSATWILKLGLGDDLAMTDEAGDPVRLRLVALLDRGLFQSEMLVSEKSLLRHFPRRAGRSFFLIDAPRNGPLRSPRSWKKGSPATASTSPRPPPGSPPTRPSRPPTFDLPARWEASASSWALWAWGSPCCAASSSAGASWPPCAPSASAAAASPGW